MSESEKKNRNPQKIDFFSKFWFLLLLSLPGLAIATDAFRLFLGISYVILIFFLFTDTRSLLTILTVIADVDYMFRVQNAVQIRMAKCKFIFYRC